MLHIDLVSIEDISAEHIREHYHRLAEFKGIPKEEFKSRIKGLPRNKLVNLTEDLCRYAAHTPI